jgi:putative restriction endonuclease
MLLLLARAEADDDARVRFVEVESKLTKLFREFGPPRKSQHPEYPFWYLQSDGIWKVVDAESFPLEAGRSPTKRMLLTRNAVGFVPARLWQTLKSDTALRHELAQSILDSFWPQTMHCAIREAVGLPDDLLDIGATRTAKRQRDPTFREAVLRAYERRCAVCGYDGQLGGVPLGIEAAHVQWHACDGPDEIANALALCVLHHIALDMGALGITENLQVLVSADVHGQSNVPELLHRFSGARLRSPQPGFPRLAGIHVRWHAREVFREPARLTN